MKPSYNSETEKLYETLEENIKKERPTLSAMSLNSYINNVKRTRKKAYEEQSFDNFDWLVDGDKILDTLEKTYPNIHTLKTIVASLVVAAKSMGVENAEVLDRYDKIMKDKRKEYEDTRSSKTAKQKDNWIDMPDIRKLLRNKLSSLKDDDILEKKNLTSAQFKRFREFMAIAMFGWDELHPPTRIDYTPMRIITDKDFNAMSKEEQDKMNWLVTSGPNKKKFVFNETKTSKKLGSILVKVSSNMNKILKPWLAVNKSKWLFPANQTEDSTPMTPSSFGKLVSRFFEKNTGKKVGITMLRTIYITDRFPQEENTERELVAKQMGHSQTQQNKYSKSDE